MKINDLVLYVLQGKVKLGKIARFRNKDNKIDLVIIPLESGKHVVIRKQKSVRPMSSLLEQYKRYAEK